MQDVLNEVESQTADFQKEARKERKLWEKAERLSSDFHKSLLTVKETLKKAEVSFENEKAILVKRAEEAEAKLEPVTEELATLKGHITTMCSAIFGKPKDSQDS